MLLKKITTFNDSTVDTSYIPLKYNFTITTPSANGSFAGRKFGYDEDKLAGEGTVAVISWSDGSEPIFITKDQAAYIIGEDGKTISIINKPPALVVWFRRKSLFVWEKLNKSPSRHAWYILEKRSENSDYEFLELNPEIDPNNVSVQDKETITWMMDSKGTSKSWRPCSQMEYELYRYNTNYAFRQCAPGEDPNQVKQEWLK